MSNTLNLILHSNLFNFAIFLLILIFIAKKMDITKVLEDMRQSIVVNIEKSSDAKSKAHKDLIQAQTSFRQSEKDIQEVMDNALETSDTFKKRILSEAQAKIDAISKNSQEIISFEEKRLNSDLISNLGNNSLKLAKDYIREELNKNPELHEKFIEESLIDLERAAL